MSFAPGARRQRKMGVQHLDGLSHSCTSRLTRENQGGQYRGTTSFMLSRNSIGFAAAFCALAALAPGTAWANGPEVGKPAPALSLSKILQAPPDAQASWDALRGKVVVLEFWATWCGPCRKSIPHWNELVDAFKGKPVQFLAISDENEQVVAGFLKQTPIHSWIGLDGVGQSMRDRYQIEGIPTTVLVNQTGMVVAVTHPMRLEPKYIEEVVTAGKTSLPAPPQASVPQGAEDGFAQVSAQQPLFEISVRPSGPVPAGHGIDCWEMSASDVNVSGQYASVKQAILTLYNTQPSLLDCRVPLPEERYDFVVRLPPGASRFEREQLVAPMFRAAFGLQIQRAQIEREVYVLARVSSNAPGLMPSGPHSLGYGGDQPGGLHLGLSTVEGLVGYLNHWLHKPVVNETGLLTNRYDIRLKWKMSKAELLPEVMDRHVLEFVEQPDPEKEKGLSEDQNRQLGAIRGKLPQAEFQKLSPDERENIDLLRAELAKPEDEQFQPDPEAIIAAIREQLGLSLSLQRRSMPVLIVEKAEAE